MYKKKGLLYYINSTIVKHYILVKNMNSLLKVFIKFYYNSNVYNKIIQVLNVFL